MKVNGLLVPVLCQDLIENYIHNGATIEFGRVFRSC